jgi:hypothetical protein
VYGDGTTNSTTVADALEVLISLFNGLGFFNLDISVFSR